MDLTVDSMITVNGDHSIDAQSYAVMADMPDIKSSPGFSMSATSSPLITRAPDLMNPSNHLKRSADIFDQHLTLREDVPRPPKYPRLAYTTSQTGLVYDVRMRFHAESMPAEDDIHPEDPRRIHAIFDALIKAGLAYSPDSKVSVDPAHIQYMMGRIPARYVTEDEACLVHTKAHYDWVCGLALKSNEELSVLRQHEDQLRMDSVYLSKATPISAKLSAGGAVEACRSVMTGQCKNAFALIRPPGHHAEREDVKGFCFFDNVSIATKVCIQEFPDCNKVLILDWDVHHGNGIQQAHYDNPNVLYISLHVHKDGKFYPEGSYRDNRERYGDHLHCGVGDGLGKNINIPWSNIGMGDGDYLHAFDQIVMPVAREFDPDLVIVAAGFDAAEGDMLGGCHVTPAGYAHMTHMLMSLAKGRIVVCLEGGYNLESIAKSSVAVVQSLHGQPPGRVDNITTTPTGMADIKKVLREQSKYWDVLYPKDHSAELAGPLLGLRMHKIVRQWQAQELWKLCGMFPLHVQHESPTGFEYQVLATTDYFEHRPLLVILHEPPEMLASADPVTGKLDLHNTWLTDIVKSYIMTARGHDFAVIDINLPLHTTSQDDTQEHQDTEAVKDQIPQVTALLTDVFNNYIKPSEASHVLLLGTEAGHAAITNFIKKNEEDAAEYIDKTIHFVQDIALQTVRSATSDELTPWYYRNSMVFLCKHHHFWQSEFARRPKKKFGSLQRSEGMNMAEMLHLHKEQVFDMMVALTEEWRIEKQEARATKEEDIVHVTAPATPGRLPPISNFALSPRSSLLTPAH